MKLERIAELRDALLRASNRLLKYAEKRDILLILDEKAEQIKAGAGCGPFIGLPPSALMRGQSAQSQAGPGLPYRPAPSAPGDEKRKKIAVDWLKVQRSRLADENCPWDKVELDIVNYILALILEDRAKEL